MDPAVDDDLVDEGASARREGLLRRTKRLLHKPRFRRVACRIRKPWIGRSAMWKTRFGRRACCIRKPRFRLR